MEKSEPIEAKPAARMLLATLILTVLASGCEGARDRIPTIDDECPSELERQVTLSGSSVPITVPAEIALAHPGAQTLLGRRIILAVTVGDRARGLRLFSSSLSISTVGGTFAGWAELERDARPGRALDLLPGRIRIRPFLGALQAQTTSLDALLIPGGVAVDEMTVSMPALWTEDQRPIEPQALQPTFNPARHFTAFDAVSATITLELVLGKSSHRWTCSFDTEVRLTGREETLPPLWGLTRIARGGPPKLWIALYERSKGPIRAVFNDPASAQGFARWLGETAATRAGDYRLVVLSDDDAEPHPGALRSGPAITGDVRSLTVEDTRALKVTRLGEK